MLGELLLCLGDGLIGLDIGPRLDGRDGKRTGKDEKGGEFVRLHFDVDLFKNVPKRVSVQDNTSPFTARVQPPTLSTNSR